MTNWKNVESLFEESHNRNVAFLAKKVEFETFINKFSARHLELIKKYPKAEQVNLVVLENPIPDYDGSWNIPDLEKVNLVFTTNGLYLSFRNATRQAPKEIIEFYTIVYTKKDNGHEVVETPRVDKKESNYYEGFLTIKSIDGILSALESFKEKLYKPKKKPTSKKKD